MGSLGVDRGPVLRQGPWTRSVGGSTDRGSELTVLGFYRDLFAVAQRLCPLVQLDQ